MQVAAWVYPYAGAPILPILLGSIGRADGDGGRRRQKVPTDAARGTRAHART